MLGLFLIYYLGKSFYTLAQKHEKKPWGYAVLGVVSYYAGSIIGGVLLAIPIELFAEGGIEEFNNFLLGLLGVPFGLLGAYLTYKLLEKRFKGETITTIGRPDILDDDLM